MLLTSSQVLLALANNAVEVYTIPTPVKSKDKPEAARLYALDLPGHRTDVRTLCLNSDDSLLASGSNGLLFGGIIALSSLSFHRSAKDMEYAYDRVRPYP